MTVGEDRWGGIAPSQQRKDLPPPPHWRLRAVAATPRPHHLAVSPTRDQVAFLLDRADLGSDVWLLEPRTGAVAQCSVDRPPMPYWEDSTPVWVAEGSGLAYEADGWVRVLATGGGPSRRLVAGSSPHRLDDWEILVSVEARREVTGTELPTATEVTRLARVKLGDPYPIPVTPPHSDASRPAVSGRRLAYTRHPPHDRNRSDVVIADLDGGEEVVVAAADGVMSHSPAWGGDRLAFVSDRDGWDSLYLWDGTAHRLTDGEGDFSSPRWSPAGEMIVAIRSHRGRAHLVLVDPASGEVTTLAEGGTWSWAQWLDNDSVVAVFEDWVTPARIERVSRAGTRTVLYEPAPLAVRTAPHVIPEEVEFSSFDGLPIHGFLFRPLGATEPVPAVVYPHGGPTDHYGDGWDGHAQYFVDKGYAWFAINFRGSTSYGRDFARAGHGTWGVADTGDCLAAADYLARLDWVDPTRLGIFGASYGSYLAVATLTSDPDHRFACGVAKYGDCDILTSWAQGDRAGAEDLERTMGHPSRARAAYRAGSPIHRIGNLAVPIFVAHGCQDRRVHPDQSAELVRELDRLGKTYEYVTYPTEGHGLLRLEPQLHFYHRLERFFDWYLM